MQKIDDEIVVIEGKAEEVTGESSSSTNNVVYNSKPYIKSFLLKHDDNKKFISDFVKLLKNSDFYDTKIKVGTNQDVKIFKTHSVILKARSLYFRTVLSSESVKKDDKGIIILEKPNISPKIFEYILK